MLDIGKYAEKEEQIHQRMVKDTRGPRLSPHTEYLEHVHPDERP